MVYDININIFIFIFKMNDISDQTYKRVKYLRLLFINILIRGGKIVPIRWASPTGPVFRAGWDVKTLARKKPGQIWPGPVWPSPVWSGPV